MLTQCWTCSNAGGVLDTVGMLVSAGTYGCRLGAPALQQAQRAANVNINTKSVPNAVATASAVAST